VANPNTYLEHVIELLCVSCVRHLIHQLLKAVQALTGSCSAARLKLKLAARLSLLPAIMVELPDLDVKNRKQTVRKGADGSWWWQAGQNEYSIASNTCIHGSKSSKRMLECLKRV
jgi:hypothetical protein